MKTLVLKETLNSDFPARPRRCAGMTRRKIKFFPRVYKCGMSGEMRFNDFVPFYNGICGKSMISMACISKMAERVGFEPTMELPPRRISSAVLSTTQPPLRCIII